jgi:hypothetical protein
VPAKPLPDDRDLLLRMLDELTSFLRAADRAKDAYRCWRRLRDSDDAAAARQFCRVQIEQVQRGRSPSTLPNRLKHRFPVLRQLRGNESGSG